MVVNSRIYFLDKPQLYQHLLVFQVVLQDIFILILKIAYLLDLIFEIAVIMISELRPSIELEPLPISNSHPLDIFFGLLGVQSIILHS